MTQPDTYEKCVRFGFGFVFGLVAGALGIGLAFYDSGATVVVVSIVTALICALASLRYGSSFWYWVKDHWFW